MKILLFGNPSMYHAYLAKGLREMGHEVTVIGHGFAWRKFPGIDIMLERRQDINPKLAFVEYMWQAFKVLRKCKGYDIVQLHHPMFLQLRGSHMKPFYKYLRRHNKRVVMCAVGYDYHVLDQIYNHNILRYSEQRIGDNIIHAPYIEQTRETYLKSSCAPYSRYVAQDADAIVACLYEYWACYNKVYPEKLHYIPMQMVIPEASPIEYKVGDKVKFFIGIQRDRTAIKGTGIMLRAAEDIVRDYPDLAELHKVEDVPYSEYIKKMDGSDAILDQLYSYTPSMNSLLAMSKGIIDIGGGEPECYEILGEKELRPIINVEPTYESVYNNLKEMILHKERIPEMKRQSVEFVKKHHDYRKVAKQFVSLYDSLLSQNG
ncbi:MAG: glycosyltransferase [Prevotella sp.]|nr:glycosyltransferase [Prevotella sp.]